MYRAASEAAFGLQELYEKARYMIRQKNYEEAASIARGMIEAIFIRSGN